MIVIARIDDRLIHGQVTVGWSRFLRLEKIVVLSDELAGDETQRLLLGMGVPEETAFEMGSVAEMAVRLRDEEFIKPRTMLLAAAPKAFRSLVLEHGFPLEEINLGGQRYEGGAIPICEGVMLTEEALADLKVLAEHGVKIEVRATPAEPKRDLFAMPILARDGAGE